MSTKDLTGRKMKKWETLLCYNLDIVYNARKQNPTDMPSIRHDYMLGALLQHVFDET